MKGYSVAVMERYPRYRHKPRAKLDRLAYDLALAPSPSEDLDVRVFKAMSKFLPDLLPGCFTRCLDDALRLIPPGWWWHISHMEARVIPTCPVAGTGGMLSNAGRYDDKGRPVGYDALISHEKERSALALSAAVISAVAALVRLAKAEQL